MEANISIPLPEKCPYCREPEEVKIIEQGRKASLLEFKECGNRIVWHYGDLKLTKNNKRGE